MYIAKIIRLGAWILVAINLLMAFAVIGLFNRMAPAIAIIIERNERSLSACTNMLAIMAEASDKAFTDEQRQQFIKTLIDAEKNATESAEPETLAQIQQDIDQAFAGNPEARQRIITGIKLLNQINVQAMVEADQQAQHLGRAGAWGVVFMAVLAFTVGLIFIRNLTRRIAWPLEEIHTVLTARERGDMLRRCGGVGVSRDMRTMFDIINNILDERTCLIDTPPRSNHPTARKKT